MGGGTAGWGDERTPELRGRGRSHHPSPANQEFNYLLSNLVSPAGFVNFLLTVTPACRRRHRLLSKCRVSESEVKRHSICICTRPSPDERALKGKASREVQAQEHEQPLKHRQHDESQRAYVPIYPAHRRRQMNHAHRRKALLPSPPTTISKATALTLHVPYWRIVRAEDVVLRPPRTLDQSRDVSALQLVFIPCGHMTCGVGSGGGGGGGGGGVGSGREGG